MEISTRGVVGATDKARRHACADRPSWVGGAARRHGPYGKDCYFLDLMGLFLLNLPCKHRETRG
eukprot:SAG31_NODE_2366_length_5859_cov_4.794097_8_plen_64_part_00